jgi:ABC-type uncharacterized transport system permease subunit
MRTAVFFAVAALYAVAAALYLAYVLRGDKRMARGGAVALGVAAIVHVGYLVLTWVQTGLLPFADIEQAEASASLLVTIGYLVAMRRGRLEVLGAFVAPISLSFFLGAGLSRELGSVPPTVRSALLPLHVGANILGIAAFGLAFGVALAYVIQERLLRQKKVGGIFQRLPPLDVLDSLSFRFVAVGFVLLTLGIVTGSFFAARGAGFAALDAARIMGLLAWVCFAAVVGLRLLAGWRGRRAAIGTMLGFACAVLVLVGYALREGGAS